MCAPSQSCSIMTVLFCGTVWTVCAHTCGGLCASWELSPSSFIRFGDRLSEPRALQGNGSEWDEHEDNHSRHAMHRKGASVDLSLKYCMLGRAEACHAWNGDVQEDITTCFTCTMLHHMLLPRPKVNHRDIIHDGRAGDCRTTSSVEAQSMTMLLKR